MTGSSNTRLIILRGNSASGKTTIAHEVRAAYGRGIAIISQDVLRREILKERDIPNGANISLIDLTVRHALDHGFHVVLEGILRQDHYGTMLEQLVTTHIGITRCYYLDIPWEGTLRRHASKPQSAEYGAEEMRSWFRPNDLIAAIDEIRLGPNDSVDSSVDRILRDTGLVSQNW